MDLKQWMTNLDTEIRNIPIIYLAIPGTHDSMTFSISQSSGVSPDCEKIVKYLLKLGPIVKKIVVRWGITQTLTVEDQLNHGVRYFDLRIGKNNKDGKFYYVHSLYGSEVKSQLEELLTFLNNNEKEIVILDFQHFYNFMNTDHTLLINEINEVFGNKICPYPANIHDITLDSMDSKAHQVIVIYRNRMCSVDERFWPSIKFPTPWPNTTSIEHLQKCLEDGVNHRNSAVGYVSQGVLTPDNRFVLLHLWQNLRRSCAVPCLRALLPWIDKQHSGDVHGVNVIISDFVEQDDAVFCKSVIKINDRICYEDIEK